VLKKVNCVESRAKEGDSPVIFVHFYAARTVQPGLMTLSGSGSSPDSGITNLWRGGGYNAATPRVIR
jgi:altronate dehydratase